MAPRTSTRLTATPRGGRLRTMRCWSVVCGRPWWMYSLMARCTRSGRGRIRSRRGLPAASRGGSVERGEYRCLLLVRQRERRSTSRCWEVAAIWGRPVRVPARRAAEVARPGKQSRRKSNSPNLSPMPGHDTVRLLSPRRLPWPEPSRQRISPPPNGVRRVCTYQVPSLAQSRPIY